MILNDFLELSVLIMSHTFSTARNGSKRNYRWWAISATSSRIPSYL